jgi:DNA-binding transcriptional LysR family regulator
VRIISYEPLVLAVARHDALAARTSITLRRLRDQPFVTLVEGSGLRVVLERECRADGFTPRIAVEAADLALLMELVAEGVGIAIVPRSATATATRPIAVVALDHPRLDRYGALAWNLAAASPAARAFLALAEAELPEIPAPPGWRDRLK